MTDIYVKKPSRRIGTSINAVLTDPGPDGDHAERVKARNVHGRVFGKDGDEWLSMVVMGGEAFIVAQGVLHPEPGAMGSIFQRVRVESSVAEPKDPAAVEPL